ncbi:MAG: DUF3999 domain-containing protein [Proteobacteria bacterium]|nr:DUF3999 domain-containing protein [Pseudomonadota bacterium]
MINLWTVFWLGLCQLALAAPPSPVTSESFSRVAPITLTEKGAVYSLDLNESVYNSVVYDDLRDLRVFNKNNQSVPFSFQLKTGEEVHQTEQQSLMFFPIMGEKDAQYGLESRVEWHEGQGSGKTTIKFSGKQRSGLEKRGYLVDLRKAEHTLRSLELDWTGAGENSFVNLTVEASDDLKTWFSVVDSQSLAKFQYAGQTLDQKTVDLPETSAKYLRITWNDSKVFDLKQLSGEFSKGSWTDTKRYFSKAVSGSQNDGDFFFEKAPVVADRIKVSLPEPNTVVRVEIASRENDQQKWTSRFDGLVYRVSRDEGELNSAYFKMSPTSDRFWRFHVFGKDAVIGTKAPELEFGWIAHRLYFLAHGEEPFKLAWGLSGVAQADFGLGSVVRELTIDGDTLEPVEAVLGEPLIQGFTLGSQSQEAQGPRPWGQYALWGGLVFVLLITAGMAYKLFKEMA